MTIQTNMHTIADPYMCMAYNRENTVTVCSGRLFIIHFIPTRGVGKERRTLIGTMVTCKKATPVTGTTLRTTGPVPADSQK